MRPLDAAKAALRTTPLLGEEDEFDPFAGRPKDPPPEDEGDDNVHEGEV